MPLNPEFTALVTLEVYIERYPGDAEDARKMYEGARAFLLGQSWVHRVGEILVAVVFPGIVAIFLAKVVVEPNNKHEFVWVLVGDIPPAFIGSECCRTPALAMEGYLGEMQAWVDAVRSGGSTADLIPVNTSETSDAADALQKRLDFLDGRILPLLKAQFG
jgi:hypothetical protein